MTSTLYRREIELAAAQQRLDANLLEALVICESSGQADAFRFEPHFYATYLAKNPAYAGMVPRRVGSSYGLCQIMYATAVQYHFAYPSPEYLFIPEINLDYGSQILADLLDWAAGDLFKALGAYNGGKRGWLRVKPQEYAVRVNRKLEEIQRMRVAC